MKEEKRVSVRIDVEKYHTACQLISEHFSTPFRDTYPRGKTLYRDFLYEKMGCSLAEAEDLVDALEKERKIKFVRLPQRKRFGTWAAG